ncbi:hypothetical protein TI04_04300 [Achromatium sp. WMS2]|nr:hypothetical protein TI04_04300 [Achromatium sp. WMS2]
MLVLLPVASYADESELERTLDLASSSVFYSLRSKIPQQSKPNIAFANFYAAKSKHECRPLTEFLADALSEQFVVLNNNQSAPFRVVPRSVLGAVEDECSYGSKDSACDHSSLVTAADILVTAEWKDNGSISIYAIHMDTPSHSGTETLYQTTIKIGLEDLAPDLYQCWTGRAKYAAPKPPESAGTIKPPGSGSNVPPWGEEPRPPRNEEPPSPTSTVRAWHGTAADVASEITDKIFVTIDSKGPQLQLLAKFDGTTMFGTIEGFGNTTICGPKDTIRCYDFTGTMYPNDVAVSNATNPHATVHLTHSASFGGTFLVAGTFEIGPSPGHPQGQKGKLRLELADSTTAERYKLGMLVRMQRYPAALELCQIMAERTENRKTAGFHRDCGTAHAGLQHYPEAVTSLLQATKLEPENIENWNDICVYQTLQGAFTAAQSSCRKGYDLDNQQYPLMVNLANAYLLAGDYNIALEWYRKAVPLIPSREALESGPLADLAGFVAKDWQVADCKKARAWLLQAFEAR